jgi:hypothetical protein
MRIGEDSLQRLRRLVHADALKWRWADDPDNALDFLPQKIRDRRARAQGGLRSRLVPREAEAALGVVEGPQQRLQHRQRLGGDVADSSKITMGYAPTDEKGICRRGPRQLFLIGFR